MNRGLFRREWGAVTFIGTVLLGGLAVLVALVIKAISPSPVPATPPCPQSTPIVIHLQPTPSGAAASPTPTISLPSVPFGCPTVAVVVRTPTPSPSATPSASPRQSPKPSPSPTASPSK
ncbi:MAG: hypothetical protein ACREOD_07325 [Candidatus Dormibacteria bacterium]